VLAGTFQMMDEGHIRIKFAREELKFKLEEMYSSLLIENPSAFFSGC
jgi:hypothetical protein